MDVPRVLLRADWLPVAADSASMEFVQPESLSGWELHPEPGWGLLRVRQRPPG